MLWASVQGRLMDLSNVEAEPLLFMNWKREAP